MMTSYLRIAFCFAMVSMGDAQAATTAFESKIIHVDDGDTIVMLDAQKRKHAIRLTDLDAPETPKPKLDRPGQPFSSASKQNLGELAKGKVGKAQCFDIDRYERLVCRVLVDGRDLSLEQIRSGFAWANSANPKYVRDSRAFLFEQEARRGKRALWADTNAIAPWIWRKICWQNRQCSGAAS
jgi:endonuclease YncB( thermonuclease family)